MSVFARGSLIGGKVQIVSRRLSLARFCQCSFLYEVFKVPRCGHSMSLREADVIFGTQPAFETTGALLKKFYEAFFLSGIQLAVQDLENLGFLNEELDLAMGVTNRVEDCVSKVDQPIVNLVVLARCR